MDNTDPINKQSQPRQPGALAAAVARRIADQKQSVATQRAIAATEQEPAFDKRTGQSNFGARVAGKIALSQQ
jgi:hypothetical protein